MRELELYLHIPFCVRKCNYCDFLSVPASQQEIDAYADALLKEIEGYGERFRDYTVTSVFFGGGTPSLLSAEQILRLTGGLHRHFVISSQAEVTLEMNPGTVTAEKLEGYRRAGINRLSIGLQSVNDGELRMLGRIHDFRGFLDTYEMVRRHGFQNVNVDLISAIPGQSVKSWRNTLRTVAELEPEHISAYSLILEEGTPFYELYGEKLYGESTGGPQKKEDTGLTAKLPGEEEERQMYEDTSRILGEYGYYRYEISNYAKPGYECRHNLGYWERKEYLGMGTGASSLIENIRYDHIRKTEDYLKYAETPEKLCCNQEKLTREAQMEEFMFLGMRKTEGIRSERFAEMFGCEIERIYGEVLDRLASERLLSQKNGCIRLTKRGMDISNYVFSRFLL